MCWELNIYAPTFCLFTYYYLMYSNLNVPYSQELELWQCGNCVNFSILKVPHQTWDKIGAQ